jgi:hypothetical protein
VKERHLAHLKRTDLVCAIGGDDTPGSCVGHLPAGNAIAHSGPTPEGEEERWQVGLTLEGDRGDRNFPMAFRHGIKQARALCSSDPLGSACR